jgi:hypothetical protein
MARTKTGTDSTPRERTIEEMRLQFNKDEARRKENYENAMEALKKLRDPSKAADITLNSYERKKIREYLKRPASSEDKLREVADYLYYRNQILYRLCHWYASMWSLDCRQIIPNYSLTTQSDSQSMLKQYENTLNKLDSFNIQGNWHDVALRCYLEDVCFTIFFRDGNDSFFYIMNPDECRIDGRYYSGDFSYSVNMAKWKSDKRRQLAEWLGEPLVSMLKKYDEDNTNPWVHMPDEWGAAFKFNSDRPYLVIPPTAAILQQIAALNDIADLQALKDEASVYKLLLVPLKTLTGSKISDDFAVSPDLMLEYYEIMKNILPEYVASAIIPGEVTNDDVIDFSTTSSDKDVDRLQQSQDTLLATSGGGSVLNANYINSTAAFKAWLMSESEFAISSLLPQIEGFTNRMLKYDMNREKPVLSNEEPCKVRYFEVTVYTKDDLKESLLTSCQYSFSNRLAYNTFNGISEKATLAMEFFENQVLHLPEIMTHPLQSSYTTSNTGDDEGGRPNTPDDELSPSGERSRNMNRKGGRKT